MQFLHEPPRVLLFLTMPFTSLTPLFLVPVAFFIMGELPGIQGIILMISGAYGLHFESSDPLRPFQSLFREKGNRYMLIVAIIWTISATVEKVAILSSSLEFYGLAIHLLLAAAYSPYVCHRGRLRDLRTHIPRLSVLGLISTAVVILTGAQNRLRVFMRLSDSKRPSIHRPFVSLT